MMRNKHGFTLVELIVTLAVFILVITAAVSILIPLVGQFKRQSKIAETNIQGLVGLKMLKSDLERAGYALPWYFSAPIAYTETAVAPANGAGVTDAPNNPPRAVAALNNVTFNGSVNGNNNITGIVTKSDYLVIKSVSVNGTATAQKWSYISAVNMPTPRFWGPPAGTWSPTNDLALNPADQVIVINPEVSTSRLRELVMNGAAFYTSFQNPFPCLFSPGAVCPPPASAQNQTYIIYGIAPGPNALTMPFNRADYFVGIPKVPLTRCAPGTGVLYKAVLDQNGTFIPAKITPLLDCVADMQVVFGLDMNGDGIIGTYSNADGTQTGDATNITGQAEGWDPVLVKGVLGTNSDLASYRSSVVEVRVYILTHEGQRDANFTYFYPNDAILVGETILDPASPANFGRTFDLTTIANYQNYRWKVYTMVVKLQNMR